MLLQYVYMCVCVFPRCWAHCSVFPPSCSLQHTSQWTLDYPPLFAAWEWLLSFPAAVVDPGAVRLSAEPYVSWRFKLFHRATVVFGDVALFVGATALALHVARRPDRTAAAASAVGGGARTAAAATGPCRRPGWVWRLVALALFHPALFILDAIHFQYNGMLLGLLLASLAAVLGGRPVLAAATFSALVCFKHLFLYVAPAVAVALLRSCAPSRWPLLVAVAAAVVVASFAPVVAPAAAAAHTAGDNVVAAVVAELNTIAARLFPFHRGLLHDYWAPNGWALYAAANKVLRGALPDPTPAACAAAVLGCMAVRVQLWLAVVMVVLLHVCVTCCCGRYFLVQVPLWLQCTRRRDRRDAVPWLLAVCLVGLAAFMFGWHVHEKALLLPLMPLLCVSAKLLREGVVGSLRFASRPPSRIALHSFAAPASPALARLFVVMSAFVTYAQTPLLFGATEAPLNVLLPTAYHFFAVAVLGAGFGDDPLLASRSWHSVAVGALPVLHLVVTALGVVLPALPFLPLLLTSVTCALGVVACWLALLREQQSWPQRPAPRLHD